MGAGGLPLVLPWSVRVVVSWCLLGVCVTTLFRLSKFLISMFMLGAFWAGGSLACPCRGWWLREKPLRFWLDLIDGGWYGLLGSWTSAICPRRRGCWNALMLELLFGGKLPGGAEAFLLWGDCRSWGVLKGPHRCGTVCWGSSHALGLVAFCTCVLAASRCTG